MECRAVKQFLDEADGMHRYKPGAPFPREGYEPNAKRIKSLIERGFIEQMGGGEPPADGGAGKDPEDKKEG